MPLTPMTYGSQIVANLRDLIGPAPLVNRRVNLLCAYSELESLLNTLLPPPVRAVPLADALDGVAARCDCGDAIAALRLAVDDARGNERSTVTAETLAAGVATVERFLGRLHEVAYPVPCACGRTVPYRLGDVLGLTPPDRFRLTCTACGTDTTWFIPSPRQ